jgi:hypothetical protein
VLRVAALSFYAKTSLRRAADTGIIPERTECPLTPHLPQLRLAFDCATSVPFDFVNPRSALCIFIR